MTWFLRVSLLRGWLPLTIDAMAWISLLTGIAWRRRRVWQWLAIAAAALAAALAIARLVDAQRRFGDSYPRSFIVWGALPFFALVAAISQWRGVGWNRRVVAVVAALAMTLFAASQINLHYGHVPTVGDLVHARLPGQVAPAQLFDDLTLRAPSARQGLVAHIDIPATTSHFGHRRGWVWVPPAYLEAPRPQLPALMLIVGTPGSPDDWFRAGGALSLANQWAGMHAGVAPILVLPDANGSGTADTECVDGPRGAAETYLSVDVPHFMVERFGVSPQPQRWAVGGISEGGTCALTLAARHPDRFSSFVDISGDAAPNLGSVQRTVHELYGGNANAWRAHNPESWFARDAALGVQGFVAVGSHDDGDIDAVESLSKHAGEQHMRVVTEVIRGGGHNWYTWKRALKDAFPWIVSRVGALHAVGVTDSARTS